jgi:hypothetical protein
LSEEGGKSQSAPSNNKNLAILGDCAANHLMMKGEWHLSICPVG